MDSETEMSSMVKDGGAQAMDTDVNLDTLVRKAVTVSQVNLPIATINRDIDDIARAYSTKENEHDGDSALDDVFVRLMENTRQRREQLDQKIARGPEAAPRKRRTPLAEDLTNVGEGAGQADDDSPKRQCLRNEELTIKPDTPAISSVKSRLHALSTQRAYWNDNNDTAEKPNDSSPMPMPRKSVPCTSEEASRSRPTGNDPHEAGSGSNPQPPSSQRRNRLAQLASNINSWEDDLSHPIIVKEEEKKPRWQPPPKASENAAPAPKSSSSTSASSKSPKKAARSPVKASAASSSNSGKAPEQKSSQIGEETKQEEKEAAPEHTEVGAEESSKLSAAAAKSKRKEEEEEKEPPTSEESQKDSAASKKGEEGRREVEKDEGPSNKAASASQLETPKPVIPPSERPLSARLANWEQKISDSKTETGVSTTPRPAVQATPQGGKVSSSSSHPPAKKICSTPQTRDKDSEVQLRPRPRKTVEDEPTAQPVFARMSAWETISSNQEVSSIKKIKPGDSAATPVKSSILGVQKSDGTPARPVTQEGIKERIAQLSTPQKAAGSTTSSMTPSKVAAAVGGSGVKSGAQWQPAQQMQSSDVTAQRLRQQRMAEVQGLQQAQNQNHNPWKHPIKDLATGQVAEVPNAGSSAKKDKRQEMREKARAEFDSKLASVGLDAANKKEAAGSQESESNSSAGVVSGKPPRPTSLFSIVSQQQPKEGSTGSPRPVTSATITSKACRKVKFDDSFESDSSDKKPVAGHDTATASGTLELVEGNAHLYPSADVSGDDEDDMDGSINSLDSFEGNPGAPPLDFHRSTVDLVKLGQQYPDSDPDSSYTQDLDSKDSGRYNVREAEESGRYNVREAEESGRYNVREAEESGRYNVREAEEESGRNNLEETAEVTGEAVDDAARGSEAEEHGPEDPEDSLEDRAAMDDLLDEALDAEEEEDEVPVMRKREATGGSLPFSINEYRASRNLQIQEVKQTIVRNSQYVGMVVKEEDVEMPTATPIPAPRQSVQEKIKELQELVQQEQSVIMQTSNAINQCCSSSFAGSTEQVECNKIILLSCQRRQAYLTEIQRLKDSGVVDPSGPGPKGSLTITDIRLPLKKDFVTKIGTSQDTMKYYFILLVRNGPQVIFTQMLSTHDPMMRGSLDFPNLIKINGISGNFQLQMDVYCMSVSTEPSSKDKKKKTPKKTKGSALTAQSPGGPLAVRMSSFSQVTTVLLDMKSVDKQCFTLDRLSHLSPLHGTIYMKLKCLMEAGVEERGFLTMFEDVSGLGSWHRRWCVLSGNRLQFWKYPDDETRKEPMGFIDLKRCVTEKVGLISRDICARPHTFELMSVRQPKKGEKDTLISRTYNTMTTIRHMLSADTKEERIVWCNKVNRALATLRTWNTDALRPISK